MSSVRQKMAAVNKAAMKEEEAKLNYSFLFKDFVLLII